MAIIAGATQDQPHKHGRPEHSATRAGWYILRCGAGADFDAEDTLRQSGWTVFVARERKWRASLLKRRRKSSEADYPRFPGYIFCRIEPPRWPPFSRWPFAQYVRGILTMSGRPVPLVAGEIERLIAEDGVSVPHVNSVPVHKALVEGQPARVTAGAFREFVARIDALDGSGARISVQLFGRPCDVRLPLTWLEPA